MISASIETNNFEQKLRILSSGLGNIFNDLLREVGNEMTADAKANAPVSSGNLRDNIRFIIKDNTGALTTRKSLNRSNIWYARMVEAHRIIKPKGDKYLTFKINGEWKKVKSVTVPGKPFMTPVYDDYFGNENGKGFKKLQEALLRKIETNL